MAAVSLRSLIRRSGLTNRQIAERSGLSESAISRYIKGDRNPKLISAEKLAQALGVSFEEVYKEWKSGSYD